MSVRSHRFNMRITQSLRDRVDVARGEVTFTTWVEGAMLRRLTDESGMPVETPDAPSSSRKRKAPPADPTPTPLPPEPESEPEVVSVPEPEPEPTPEPVWPRRPKPRSHGGRKQR